MSVKFEDFTIDVIAALDDAAEGFLYEAAELLKGQAAENTPVASGQLKGQWDYSVDTSKMEAQIGNPLENALWNEFGTGEHALNGDGRKGGWSYKDDNGNWHHTIGKRPRRSLQSAFNAKKASIIRRAEQIFKDRMG